VERGILVMVLVGQGVTLTSNNIHDSSHWAPWAVHHNGSQKAYGTPDVHGIAITNYSNSPIATSYAQGIHIVNNTIHDAGGNGIRRIRTATAGQSNHVAFVTIDGNEIYNSAKQNWDSKGRRTSSTRTTSAGSARTPAAATWTTATSRSIRRTTARGRR